MTKVRGVSRFAYIHNPKRTLDVHQAMFWEVIGDLEQVRRYSSESRMRLNHKATRYTEQSSETSLEGKWYSWKQTHTLAGYTTAERIGRPYSVARETA